MGNVQPLDFGLFSSPTELKEFSIMKILGIVQEAINSSDHNIPRLLERIEDEIKGTKAQPFYEALCEHFKEKFGPQKQVDQIVQKFSELIAQAGERIRNNESLEDMKAPRNRKTVHRGYQCGKCGVSPIVGVRYYCPECMMDMCESCEDKHDPRHEILKPRLN